MTEVTATMVIAACDAYRKWCNRTHYAEAMRRAIKAALDAEAASPAGADEGPGRTPIQFRRTPHDQGR